MKIIFCTSNKIGARLIRAVTWSDWSHVGIINGDEVIEAVYPRVKATPLHEVIANHTRYCIVDIPCPDEAAAIKAALSQIGKIYDLKGMLGLGINRDWQDDSKWWCSELVAWAILQGGLRIFRDGVMHRITQQHLFMLNFAAGE
ncbi:MAG: YiiX/YebB-like N1pC/P60 family cysteine hydrolase [Gallionellaceae bacterium]|jgi:hypothetical protein